MLIYKYKFYFFNLNDALLIRNLYKNTGFYKGAKFGKIHLDAFNVMHNIWRVCYQNN